MSLSLLGSGLTLLQAVGHTLPDTQVVKQVTSDPGVFQKVTTVADGLMTITILVLAVALVPAAWNFHRTFRRVNELLDRFYGDIQPLVHNASTVADNVNYVTTTMRADAQRVTQTVATANQKVLTALRHAEQRVQELNALVDVMQEEAERVFVATASTIRGMQGGAEAFAEEGRLRRRAELVEEDFDEEFGEALDEVFDEEGLDDDDEDGLDDDAFDQGDSDDGDTFGPERGHAPPQPRIRPRRHP